MQNYAARFFIIFILFFWTSLIFAQDKEFIRAIVLDEKTGEPIIFATVRIIGKQKGVITNMDGSFRLPKVYRDEGESIEISSMGYEKKSYQLLKLLPNDVNILKLSPGVFSLTEAVVMANKKQKISAKQIISKAIENISRNYPHYNFTIKGYYRDYQKDTVGYVNLNEALLEVFDSGFNTVDTASTRARIFNKRQNFSFRRDTLADDPYNYKNAKKTIDGAFLKSYGGNEFTILRVHDAIRNHQLNSYDFINNMKDGDILKNHSFKKLEDTYFENNRLYTIQLTKYMSDYVAQGTFYISKNDYAIHKIKYSVVNRKRTREKQKSKRDNESDGLVFEVLLEYKRESNDKMYLNYISLHNTFKLAVSPKFYTKLYEFIMTGSSGYFMINFNNKININLDLDKPGLFKIDYRGKRIKFHRKTIINDSVVILYPSMKPQALNIMHRELSTMAENREDPRSVLNVEVKGIYDEYGNLVNEWTYKSYDQFKEFFVQEIQNKFMVPPANLLMNTRKPIFENESKAKLEDGLNLWMNTPLQGNKE